MYLLEWVQQTTGLPWWATILGCTVGLRTILVPASVMLTRTTSRLAVAKPELELVKDELNSQMAMCGDDYMKQSRLASEAQTKMWGIYKKHNANPLWTFVPIILQVPSFGLPVCVSVCVCMYVCTVSERRQRSAHRRV